MHPYIDMVAVETLRAHLPAFAGPYHALEADYGEDLTPQVVFQELADLVATALLAGDEDRFAEDAFAALEARARAELAAAGGGLWFADAAEPDAGLVDLESAACAAEADAAGVPWLVVRAVSDGPDDRLPPWLVPTLAGLVVLNVAIAVFWQ